ncbi:hypothetical protein [Cellulosilyticum ruminicola]|uniref:hypothetical protein n=1 Tax=Cellulosilyticum ruminicola TaxID=425254 RepID=UPI0006CF50C6|nr:hypothetical protein [Cellulosilyticum ruminicola]
MKKHKIFLSSAFIWSVVFFGLAIYENSTKSQGLSALTSLGNFVLYAGLSIIGIVALVIGVIKWLYDKNHSKK